MLPDIEHIAYPTMTVAQSLEWSLNRHCRNIPERSAVTSETKNASPSSSSPPPSRSSPDTDISVFIDPELKNHIVAEQHPQSLDQILALSKTLFLPTGNPTSSSTAPPPSAPNKHTFGRASQYPTQICQILPALYLLPQPAQSNSLQPLHGFCSSHVTKSFSFLYQSQLSVSSSSKPPK